MSLEQVEAVTGCQIKLVEQLPPTDDTLGGDKCAVKRWRVDVVELKAHEVEALRVKQEADKKALELEQAKLKKDAELEAKKIAAEAAKNQPPPPPKP